LAAQAKASRWGGWTLTLKPVTVEDLYRSKPNLEALVPRVVAAKPQAVLFFRASEIALPAGPNSFNKPVRARRS
jgi:hypothetical protein